MSEKLDLLMHGCQPYVKDNFKNASRDKGFFSKLIKAIDKDLDVEKRLKILLCGYSISELAKRGEAPASLNRGNRSICGGVNGETEHPMTKCMYYYNRHKSGVENICPKCSLQNTPWKNISDRYDIYNYQLPLPFKHSIGSVGKIDLIVKDRSNKGIFFAVEIKPEKGNNESLSRMMAEIITYTTVLEYAAQKNGEEYSLLEGKRLYPAIAFFKEFKGNKTKQFEMYEYYPVLPEFFSLKPFS